MPSTQPIAPHRSFKVDALQVQIYHQQPQLALDAALAARACLQMALQDQGEARVIFACATSQVNFLSCLTSLEGLDWSRITVFHMDEYLGIESNHPASFRRFLQSHLLNKVNPNLSHLLEGDSLLPEDECERYGRLLRQKPTDLCCLGIGENGHLAFNDPPVARFEDARWVKLVKLDLACRQQQVGEGCFPDLDGVPRYAMTLTIPALCEARRMICVVPESRKAQAVRATLLGPISTLCPASILRRHPKVTLYLDDASASLLPSTPN